MTNRIDSVKRHLMLKATVNYDGLPDSAKLVFDTVWQAQQQEINRITANADRDRGTATNLLITALADKCTQLVGSPDNAHTVAMAVAFIAYLLEQTPEARIHLDKIVGEIKAAIEDYYKALNRREHGGNAAHHALASIQTALDMSWDGYNKANALGNYAILAKEAEDYGLSS